MPPATTLIRPESIQVAPTELLRALIMPTTDEIRRARLHLQCKAAAIMAIAVTSYIGLVIARVTPIMRAGSAVVLVLAVIGIATSVMHDANHQAFSTNARVNRTVGYASDLLGASSLLWRIKHAAHHADTNVSGIDPDIDQAPFARLAPQQPWHAWHRYQHLYLWPLYGFLGLQWFLLSDYVDMFSAPGTDRTSSPITRRDRLTIVAGKAVHASWALALPLALHRWWVVLSVYVACSWCVGFALAVMFQVAHAVDGADITGVDAPRRGDDFVAHQLRTTLDVGGRRPGTSALRGIMGGLDHQVEHHLAPQLPHTLYPRMARRLQAECAEASVRYRSHDGLVAALRSHARHLRAMAVRPVDISPAKLSTKL